MDTEQIEQKLARRPFSPLFARLADAYLRDGRTEAAKELLLSGLEKYPSYPTAHLILARCFAAGRQFPEAIEHLRIAASALPEVDHLLELEVEWEEHVRRRVTIPAIASPALAEDIAEAVVTEVAEPASGVGPPEAPPLPVIPAARPSPSFAGRIEDGRIVSKTLAEIYAMQGEYGEAIITYTMLKNHRPQMSAECDLRISELEQALQAKLNQQKIAVSK